MHRKLLKRALSALLALILFCFCLFPAGAENIRDLEQQQQDLEDQRERLQEELDKVKDDRARQEDYRETLLEQITTIEQQVTLYNEQINGLTEQISQLKKKISENQAIVDERYEKLKKRLHAIYLAGEASAWDWLLGAENIGDFLERTELIRTVSEYDVSLVSDIKTQKENMEAERVMLEDKINELDGMRATQERKQLELDDLVIKSEELLSELEGEEERVRGAQKDIDEEEDRIGDEIEAWYRQYQQGQIQKNTIEAYVGGNYIWPLPGYWNVIGGWFSYYGHRGIDIAGPGVYGKPIVAANSGRVIRANVGNWGQGWGNYVMIDHGGGYATLYAHCSSLNVRLGQYVQQGQVIAYVGNTGNSYGYHLHFETWKNGSRYNPMTEF